MNRVYKIPYNLNANFLNTKQKLKDEKTGIGIDKKFSARVLLTFVVAMMFWGWLCFNSGASKILEPTNGSWIGWAIFSFGYVCFAYFSLREISVPGLYGYNVFAPLFHYLSIARNPEIPTKKFNPYANGVKITGMVEPTDTGYLRFAKDGSYGVTYRIVGTASENTFSTDREQTVNQFANLLRTLPADTTYAFVTNTGGQKVSIQLKHLLNLYDHESDALMMSYIAEDIRELSSYVQDNFFALHQYLILHSSNLHSLREAEKQLGIFMEQTNGSVITMIERPKPKDERAFYRTLYCGLDTVIDDERLKKFKEQDKGRKSEAELAGSRVADLREKANQRGTARPARIQAVRRGRSPQGSAKRPSARPRARRVRPMRRRPR